MLMSISVERMDPTDLLTVANGASKVVLQGEQFPGMEGIRVQVHLVKLTRKSYICHGVHTGLKSFCILQRAFLKIKAALKQP